MVTSADKYPKEEDLDLANISYYLMVSIREIDWIQLFNHEERYVNWNKCPFIGHYPWDIDCDCKECEED